jgi:hypothetical protein
VNLFQHARAERRILGLRGFVEIERRGNAAFDGAVAPRERVEAADVAQAAQKRALHETEGVLDGGGLGYDDQETDVRDQEEVEGDEARSRRQIANEEIDVELAHLGEQAVLGGRLGIGGPQRIAFAGDEAEAAHGGLDDAVLDARNALVEEVAQRDLGPLDADEGVQVGAAQIGVDQDDALAELRQVYGEVGGEQRLADAALAAANGQDAAPGAIMAAFLAPLVVLDRIGRIHPSTSVCRGAGW